MKIECSGSCGRTLDIRTVRVLNWNTNEAIEPTEERVYVISEPKYLCKRCHDKILANGMFDKQVNQIRR
jgi:hypothetical protein